MLPCTCFCPRTKRNVKQNQKLKGTADQKCIRDPSSSSAKPESASSSETPLRYEIDTKIFTYRELATATNDFKREALLGRGGFGAVYKGRLESTGQNVAVKMLDPSGAQGDKEFLVEVLMLSLLRHQNLVKLIGYCAEGDQRLLVYEYMPLGSLEDHLFEFTFEKDVLDWSTRMQIAAGAARGLQHLHNEAQPAVIYRDLKSANILLDHNYKPKLSDFGLAKFGPGDNMTHVSTRVMGTHGYCAPEYANSGRLTAKSDIYSFGVVMLELISGRRAIGDSSIGPNRLLVNWARHFIVRNIKQIVDPMLSIQGRYMETTLKGALDLAFMCLREDANARPSISEVVNALDYIVDSLTRREKKKSIEHVQGVELEQKATVTVSSPNEMMNSNEKEVSEREKAVAEAKNWAENLRLRKPSNKPPTPSP